MIDLKAALCEGKARSTVKKRTSLGRKRSIAGILVNITVDRSTLRQIGKHFKRSVNIMADQSTLPQIGQHNGRSVNITADR